MITIPEPTFWLVIGWLLGLASAFAIGAWAGRRKGG